MASTSTLSKQPFEPAGAAPAGISSVLPVSNSDTYPPNMPGDKPATAQHAQQQGHKRRNIIILTVVAIVVVLAVALGAGLGAGLKHHKNKNVSYAYSLPGGNQAAVPPGQDDSKAGMLESGYYTTAYENTDNSFEWSTHTMVWNGTNTAGADLVIGTNQRNTPIDGFGAALTDASASLLMQIKQTNASVYNSTLYSLFNRRSGLSIVRVPIGASDYSLPGKAYTFADSQGSSSDALSKFSPKGAQQYIFPILRDILAVNPQLKISILPWTPPAWMKATAGLNGGSLSNGMTATLVEYLAKSVQAFDTAVGVKPWALAVQNEPFNSMPYPSMVMTTGLQIQVLSALRGRLAELGYGDTLLWGLEDDFVHWDAAETLIKQNASSLDGVAWHCYNGSWQGAQSLRGALPSTTFTSGGLRMAMTECTGQDTGSSDVSSFRWWSQNIFFPMLSYNFSSILVWNLALNSDFGPHLSSTICQNCKGAIEIDKASIGPSLQSIMMQHMAVASSDLTRFGSGAGPATSLNATISHGHSCGEALAFAAPWNSSATRYGLVVENACANQTTMSVALNQRTTTLNFAPGLTSYVWTM